MYSKRDRLYPTITIIPTAIPNQYEVSVPCNLVLDLLGVHTMNINTINIKTDIIRSKIVFLTKCGCGGGQWQLNFEFLDTSGIINFFLLYEY